MVDACGFIDELEKILKALYASMKDGSYEFATGDLDYVPLMAKYHEAVLPFKRFIKTHQ